MAGVLKRAGFVAGAGLWLLAAGCGGDARSADSQSQAPAPALLPSTVDERPKIVALGDSLTAGNGLMETESFPGLIQAMIDRDGYEFEVINAGVSGDTSAGGLRRLDWVLKEDVSVLIVALGANDGLRGLSVAQMTANLSQIIERAQERRVAVILAGMEAPPNYGPEYAAAYRQAFSDLARKYRVTFVPFLLAGVAGVSGDTSAGGLRRLDWILTDDTRVVIVALGANDGLRGLSVGQMKRNLSEIIERVRAKGAIVILAGMEAPPNYGSEYAVAFRAAYADLARQHRVTFVPFLLEGVAGVGHLNQSDGIHPTAAGTQMVAETIWKALNPILDQLANS